MAVLSKSAIYGIRATLYVALAEEQNEHPHTSIRKIADDLDISFHFLTKILQTLTQQGIVGSTRGPKGGVHLATPTQEVSLLDIITAIEGPDLMNTCIIGLPNCGSAKPCPLHEAWAKQRANLEKLFTRTTLASLTHDFNKNNYRLNEEGLLNLINPA